MPIEQSAGGLSYRGLPMVEATPQTWYVLEMQPGSDQIIDRGTCLARAAAEYR